ncbi:MAG TPA: hypothetical protein VMM38_12075 [Aridibacter sp.]|nr:hypothetical protein [Aridibacter sp.]
MKTEVDGIQRSPQVILIARKYASGEDALRALSKVSDTGPEDKYFVFYYSLVKDDTLFSLWGACYFDVQVWDTIKRKFDFAVLGEGHVPQDSVAIPCDIRKVKKDEPSQN